MRSIILESIEDFEEYKESWEALRHECGVPIFSSYDLVRLWLDNFKSEVKPYLVLIEERGELVGAAPMCTSHTRGLPIDCISMVGNLYPLLTYNLFNVFAKQDNPDVIREMVSCIKRAKWNKLFMSHMEMSRSNLKFLDGIVQMWERRSSTLNPAMHHFYVFPPEGNIAAEFGKRTRGNLRRLRNKLEREGRMNFRRVKSVDEAEGAIQLYLSQHEERWEPRNSDLRTWFNRRLLLELGKLAVNTGKGEISELLIDGEVAGQLFYFLDGDVSRGIRVGMTEKFQDFSPGLMVQMLTMEDNRKRGIKAFDPGHGNEEYKLRMTNRNRALGSALVYKGTMGVISRVRSFAPVRILEDRLRLQERIMQRFSSV